MLADIISELFKRRNYQVVSIYSISKDSVTRHQEVFQSFLDLKRRDLQENMHNLKLNEKIPTYKKLHNEINFIFNICDKHNELKKNEIYNYIKESLVNKSEVIGEKYSIYKIIDKKYEKLHFLAKCTFLGFLY